MKTETLIDITINEVSPPFFNGGSGWFEVRPLNAMIYFFAANKEGSKNNTHPWFEDEDIERAKLKADTICKSVNNFDSMLNALNLCYNLFQAEFEDLSDQGKRVHQEVIAAILKATHKN